jgi:tRNA modification GTPase
MRVGDTIVAHASAPGASARAVVRVSGPESRPIARWAGLHDWRRCVLAARIPVGGPDGLAALAMCFPAPNSYTGEDAVEFLIPGASALVERIVALLLEMPGVRLASPGEFTARAHLHGQLTVEQAEGVALLISARSEAEREAAARLLDGRVGAGYESLAGALADALALVEAGIDFTDQEDVVAIAPNDLTARLQQVRKEVVATLSSAGEQSRRSADAVVCLTGAPSAGKSTLFNALLGRARAVVAPEAGTTRDALREILSLDDQSPGLSVSLVDLAGLDAALSMPGTVDAESQRAARRVLASADVVIHCDPTGRFGPLPGEGGPITLRVRTKADLPGGGSTPDALAVCALDGWRVGALRRAIADAALATVSRSGADLAVLPRHVAALTKAQAALDDAIRRVRQVDAHGRLHDEEILAGLMREALDALGEISGRIEPDDVIGRVFAHFCVGK